MPALNKVEVVREFLERLGRQDIDGAGELLDQDAVMVFPFIEALEDVKGKAAIVAQIKATMVEMLESMNFTFDAGTKPPMAGP